LPRAKRPTATEPSNAIDLMAALKHSLAAKSGTAEPQSAAKPKRSKTPDRRQGSMLLPVSGGRKTRAPQEEREEEAAPRGKRRKKAS